jgi:ribokinase
MVLESCCLKPAVNPVITMIESIRVAVVGSCNVDLNCYLSRMPQAGETIIGNDFETRMGGKGANQAVAAARFGSNVAFIGAVGSDNFGELVISNFGIEGVHHEHVAVVEGATGVAQIWIAADGENRIVVISGANAAMTAERAMAMRSYPGVRVALGQLEIAQSATAAGFAIARANGAVTILNPTPFEAVSPELMAVTDWLIVNEVEFTQLHRAQSSPLESNAVEQLAEQTECNLVVTLGARGAVLLERGQQIVSVTPPAVGAIDTVGAGDCFVGSFAHCLAHDLTSDQALAVAVAASALSVQRRGAQSSFPSRSEATELLDQELMSGSDD